MTPRVLFDATSLPPRPAGVGQYILNLLAHLARRPEDLDLHVAVKRADVQLVARAAPGATLHETAIIARPLRLAWEQTVLPQLARRIGADLVHGPHYTLPLLPGPAAVVTFHDPTFFTDPELHERSKVAYFRAMTRLATRRAARVIAVSQYARAAAERFSHADPGRIDTVYLGVDVQRYATEGDPDADERLRSALGVALPYVLWIGTIEPRKDLPTLVEAFASLAANTGHRLVIAGQPGWGVDAFETALERSGTRERIVRIGYVTEEQKLALYRGADVLAYPSIAEGFGIQVVEAMAAGCPVVTTTGSAPEEVGADAVLLVRPRDAAQLAAALERVLNDAGTRATLIERGLARARSFDWSRTADGTVGSYRRALGVR